MKHRILLVCSLFIIFSCCKKSIIDTVDKLGFEYDEEQDIYVSKVKAWQRNAGYSSLIDLASVPASMVIHCEPIKFEYNGKQRMIELWKGQYGVSTGAEIGIYKKDDPNRKDWICGKNEDMLKMSYVLKRNGETIFKREGTHWWLTGFKPGEFSEPGELTMDITISFDTHTGMLDEFVKGMKKLGYDNNDYNINGDSITFVFDVPKSKQPLSDKPKLVKDTQKRNKNLVEMYNKAKANANVDNNSPESIEKILLKMPKLILELNTYKFD